MPIKKRISLFMFLVVVTLSVSAQHEVRKDTIGSSPSRDIMLFGDFMLDMTLLAPQPQLPSFSENMLAPNATKDYSMFFQLPTNMTLSSGYMLNRFQPYGYGMFSSGYNVQSATFKLNDNMSLTTFGQYRLDGTKAPNPGTLPWEKDNFMGGMELKFNKNFGIRIEVQRGRNPMYPY